MQLRAERPGDASYITAIHFAAFRNHPMHAPGSEPLEPCIVERLRATGALALSLVAEVDGEPVGHLALSPTVVGKARSGWFLLGPIGVLPQRQGRGIGTALVRAACARMRDRGAAGIVLVGDPGFYGRFGFVNLPGLGYRGVPDTAARFILARGFGKTPPAGEIIAHDAFTISET